MVPVRSGVCLLYLWFFGWGGVEETDLDFFLDCWPVSHYLFVTHVSMAFVESCTIV